MGVRLKVSKQIDKKINDSIDIFIKKKIDILIQAGEILIELAKTNGNYLNHTHNLRKSIGYVVTQDGVLKGSRFENDKGKERAINEALKFKGLVLVVIAGESYAIQVESKGYDVLTSSHQIARNLLPKLLK